MAILTIDRNPPPRLLRSFGLLLAVFVPLFGALIWWRTGRLEAGTTIWVAGGILIAVYWAVRPVRRLMYVGWMYAAFPIGWTVSHVLMALIFYLVMTPIGWLMRATGRDPLFRRFDRSARTYWISRPQRGEVANYFRQY